MRVKSAALAALFAVAPGFPVLAQPTSATAQPTPAVAPPTTAVAQIVFQHPKPGMEKQYEAGRKKHMAWHKSQKDAWSWFTWQVVSGEQTGLYITGTFGHAWKDFDGRDKFEAADLADLAVNVGPSVASTTVSYYVERADLSLSPSTPASSPAPLIALTAYTLKPEGLNDFIEGVKKVNEGIKKTNYAQSGPSRWYQLVNGGEGPSFVLVGDRANWAAFQANPKTLDAMMEEAYGKEQGAAILATLRKAFRTIRSSADQYRPELSYVAPK